VKTNPSCGADDGTPKFGIPSYSGSERLRSWSRKKHMQMFVDGVVSIL